MVPRDYYLLIFMPVVVKTRSQVAHTGLKLVIIKSKMTLNF